MNNIPYIRFYLSTNVVDDRPKGMNRLEFEKYTLFKMLEYHYDRGHCGFLSEQSTLKGIFEKIQSKRIDTDYEWYIREDKMEIKQVFVYPKDEDDTFMCIEKEDGFVRWIDNE